MAWSLINSALASASTGNAVTTTAMSTSGASLLLMLISQGNTTATNPSDSAGNSWTLAVDNVVNAPGVWLYYVNSASPKTSAAHTFTGGGTGGFASIIAWAFSGSAASPLDQTNNAQANVASLQTGSITPTKNNSLLIAGLAGTMANPSINNSFTEDQHFNNVGGQSYSSAGAHLVQATAIAINPAWSWTGSSQAAALIASFFPGQTITGGGDLQLLLGDSIGWTPSLLGRPLSLLAAAAAGSAARLIRSGAKISRRALWTGRDH